MTIAAALLAGGGERGEVGALLSTRLSGSGCCLQLLLAMTHGELGLSLGHALRRPCGARRLQEPPKLTAKCLGFKDS